jgi:hypothetical protein
MTPIYSGDKQFEAAGMVWGPISGGEPLRRETVDYRHVADFDTPGTGKSSRRYSQQYQPIRPAVAGGAEKSAYLVDGPTCSRFRLSSLGNEHPRNVPESEIHYGSDHPGDAPDRDE